MTGPHDPSAAIVRDGSVLALADEERFIRHKHAFGIYPINAVRYCLQEADAQLADVRQIAVPWDVDGYSDGSIAAFFRHMAVSWEIDEATKHWQAAQLAAFNRNALSAHHGRELRRAFGAGRTPPIVGPGHHYSHAFQAGHESPFGAAVVLVLDGSGDTHTGTVWLKAGTELQLLREITMPHSVGWFYAAMTEYLGFQSSDGEFKVMGLAAYGRPNRTLDALISNVLQVADNGVDYQLDPRYIHYGPHSYSGRFTDHLVDLFGRLPRARCDLVRQWHMDLALAAQTAIERAACRLVDWAVAETGVREVCVGGGVAMNVKLCARIARLAQVRDVFAHPGCPDNGAAAGAALAACHAETGHLPPPLGSTALGPSYAMASVESVLRAARVPFERSADVVAEVARELAAGAVVGWFSGRMEAGARALGHRSILADPRTEAMRDRVNDVIKQREPWRPFAPSIPEERFDDYTDNIGDARFMTMSFTANRRLRTEAPAVVHVDWTSRIHKVARAVNPPFHRLLEAFGQLTGVPILLNTSFNLAGEPIVCGPLDALRTFWASGLDVLVLEELIVRKPPESGATHDTESK